MQELISRIVSSLGIDESLAETAVGTILGLLKDSGPQDKVSDLLSALPGAEDLIGKVAGGGGGGMLGGALGSLGGMLGGSAGGALGALGALSSLKDAGLSTDQVKGVGGEVLGYAKEKAGDGLVNDLVGSIPGLDKFL